MNYLPLDYFGFFAAAIYALCMLALCSYALHSLYLLWRYKSFIKNKVSIDDSEPTSYPKILVQIPTFNERDVVCRAMDAAAALDWPRSQLEIQLLDDSTDDCFDRAQQHAEVLQQRGVPISVIHRVDRIGYKAGALEAAMQLSDAEYVAIFDADFIPNKDFLKKAIKPLLEDQQLALVQGRWEHLNREDNILCKAQAIGIDGHFAIEQGARAWSGLALNFNGTCGLWRRAAIEDAGGWEHDTLTEDMDLSYRAQLRGWRCTFCSELAVPGEIPDHVDAWRSQQFRWAKGSIQTAKKLLPRVWQSNWSLGKKIAAGFHMTHYFVHPFMLLSLLCAPIALGLCPKIPDPILMLGLLAFLIGIGSPFILYASAEYILHGRSGLKRMRYFPALAAIGTGIAISNTRAVLQACAGTVSAFIRTPKKGDSGGSYSAHRESGFLELLCALWAGLGIVLGLSSDRPWITPLLLIYVSGFAWVGILSMYSWLRQLPHNNYQTPKLIYIFGVLITLAFIILASIPETWVYAALPYTALGLIISAAYLASVFILKRKPDISRQGILFILVCGLIFRIAMLIGMTPSDDLNRYIVEGRQAAYAQNPYQFAPHDPATRALLDQHLDPRITDQVNHPTWTAIYPPLNIGIEMLITHIESTPMSIKVAIFITEILAICVVSSLLFNRGLSQAYLLLVWWNPIGPIWLSGEGHNDAWMMLFVLIGIWFLDKAAHKRSIIALSCAALCKPFAAWALLPSLLKSKWYIWLLPIGIATIAYLPFISAGSSLFNSLGRFGSELHFHGALEPPIRFAWSFFISDQEFLRSVTVISLIVILLTGSALLIWRDVKGLSIHGAHDPAALCAKLFALLFFCLPTVYPWYLTPLLFLLPFIRGSWGIIFWTAMTPVFWLHGLAIASNNGEWTETTWVSALAHIPALLFIASEIFTRSKPWRFFEEKSSVQVSNS